MSKFYTQIVKRNRIVQRSKQLYGKAFPYVTGAIVAAAPGLAFAQVDADTYGLPTLITALIALGGAIYLAMGGFISLIAGAEMAFGYLWKWVKKAGGGR